MMEAAEAAGPLSALDFAQVDPAKACRFKAEMDRKISQIDDLVLQSRTFWKSFEALLGSEREEHAETLVLCATSARGRERALASITHLAHFWSAFAICCNNSASIAEAEAVANFAWLARAQ